MQKKRPILQEKIVEIKCIKLLGIITLCNILFSKLIYNSTINLINTIVILIKILILIHKEDQKVILLIKKMILNFLIENVPQIFQCFF